MIERLAGSSLGAEAAVLAVCRSCRLLLLLAVDALLAAGRNMMLPYTVKFTGQVSAAHRTQSLLVSQNTVLGCRPQHNVTRHYESSQAKCLQHIDLHCWL